ncbi:hypothetical protein LZ518_05300 [Sphingomonas sp. RB56-2]|uniref:Uncharacterized protein n=1 Tax=Sphingomonas brevis TaxID=2908206 RepID=A0ABT0S892_9SPHN|nr:hypothetical protein [Sphingomonas brevis]MCL6740547.1 hypothetical protein [Sphingomonas brevis]
MSLIIASIALAASQTPPATPAVAPAAPPAAEKKMACCEKMAKGEGCSCCKDMAKKDEAPKAGGSQ